LQEPGRTELDAARALAPPKERRNRRIKLGRVKQRDLRAREPSSFNRRRFHRYKIYGAVAPTMIGPTIET
jgi:hypothetical protein